MNARLPNDLLDLHARATRAELAQVRAEAALREVDRQNRDLEALLASARAEARDWRLSCQGLEDAIDDLSTLRGQALLAAIDELRGVREPEEPQLSVAEELR